MFAGVDADCTVSLFWEQPRQSEPPRLYPRNSTNLSIRSSRTIVSFLSRRLVTQFTLPHRTHPATPTSPRRITQEGSGTIQQHASVIQLSSLRLSSRSATRFMTLVHYFRSPVFVSFGAAPSCLSQYVPPLRRPAWRFLCSTHRLSLPPTRRATIKHTRFCSSHCSTVQNHLLYQWEFGLRGGTPRSTALLFFFFGRVSINLNYS